MQLKDNRAGRALQFENGVSVQILLKDGRFGGLGEVKLKRRKLRSAERPIYPLIATPDGYEVASLELEDVEKSEEGLALYFTPYVALTGRMEWVGCDGEDRWNLAAWAAPPERDRGGLVRLKLRAVNHTLGGIDFHGFSYSWKFRSRKYSIYRLHDRATWELGGTATGNELWMTGPFNAPRLAVQNKQSHFTTAWCRHGVQMQQFLPLFGALQGFTFQFDRRSLLVTAFEQPFHCRSLFEKQAGSNCVVHWHQLFDDLSGCVEFPELQVLCAPGEADADQGRGNQYCAVRSELHKRYRAQAGLGASSVVPGAWLDCERETSPRAVKHCLDRLGRTVCHRVYVSGLGAKPATAARVPIGAPEFIAHAHKRGLSVAVPLSECCQWVTEGDPDQGSAPSLQAPLVAAAMGEGQDYARLLERLQRVHTEFGVDVLYCGDVLSQIADRVEWHTPRTQDVPGYDDGESTVRSIDAGHRRLVSDLQGLGYQCLLGGALGLGALMPAPDRHATRGVEFLLRDRAVSFDPAADGDAKSAFRDYFRGCAHRVGYTVTTAPDDVSSGEAWEEKWAAVNRAFQAVREHMEHSHLLSQDRAVLWNGLDADLHVMWTFKAFQHTVGDTTEVFDVMSASLVKVQDGVLEAKPFRVYLLQRGLEGGNRDAANGTE